MSLCIGHVLAVSGVNVTVEVDPSLSDLHVRHEGSTYTVGQPGTYIVIDAGHDKHLVLVQTVRKSEWTPLSSKPDEIEPIVSPRRRFPYLPPASSQIDKTLIDGVLVGVIVGQRFEVGASRLPVVGDAVTLALEDHLRIALSPPSDRAILSLGNYVDSSLPVFLDVDNLLGKHTAIVGTTGCGKSYMVARMINQIVEDFPAANIVIFDLHGEYKECFGDRSRHIRADMLSLPAWLHGFDDLFSLCADLGNQFNIHNQRWAFRDGILKLKQDYCREVLKDENLASKIDLDAPIPFKFEHLQNYLHNLNSATYLSESGGIALEAGASEDWFYQQMPFQAKRARIVSGGPLNGELDRLVMRVDARVNDPRYAFMFQYEIKGEDDLAETMRGMTGFLGGCSRPITIFDLSFLPSETVGIVVATLSRALFQVHFLAERGRCTPTLMVYEEAHNYISRSGNGPYGEARDSVERIAKEGRKFGIGAIVVSQRPSELSETLLSQCNTFLCMRLSNTMDKNHVVALLPDSMQMLAAILPALPRGQVMAVGQAVKMPVRFVVNPVKQNEGIPNSQDPEFGKHWNQEMKRRREPDIAEICEFWIRAEKSHQESKPLPTQNA